MTNQKSNDSEALPATMPTLLLDVSDFLSVVCICQIAWKGFDVRDLNYSSTVLK
jgi:hypothetical protein